MVQNERVIVCLEREEKQGGTSMTSTACARGTWQADMQVTKH